MDGKVIIRRGEATCDCSPLDLETAKAYDAYISKNISDYETLYICSAQGRIGRDDMSLLCVIVREDFAVAASDTKWTLPMREHGGDVLLPKFFQIEGTCIVIGATGTMTYGKRYFHDIINDEISKLDDKSYDGIRNYVEKNFRKYIKENGNATCGHFATVYLFGYEHDEFHGCILDFTENGALQTHYSMGRSEYFSGDKEGCEMLEVRLETAKANGLLDTKADCEAFLEDAITEIIQHYKTKPLSEQVIGGVVDIAVLSK